MRICSARATAVTIHRTAPLARRDDEKPAVFVGLQVSGSSLVAHELLRAVLTSQRGAADLARGPMEATPGLRITRYIRQHLADRDLSAARIAAAHGISVRHLYAVLARSGISLRDHVHPQRLAECRRELAGPHGRARTIAAIGRRWGFVDAAHFSKVFKRAYGMTPRDWRGLHHPR
nr:helix-turn-helix domain-containing protein [Streptomyces griseoincarnatus]